MSEPICTSEIRDIAAAWRETNPYLANVLNDAASQIDKLKQQLKETAYTVTRLQSTEFVRHAEGLLAERDSLKAHLAGMTEDRDRNKMALILEQRGHDVTRADLNRLSAKEST